MEEATTSKKAAPPFTGIAVMLLNIEITLQEIF